MGVSGSGKSTVGRAAAQALGWAFVEGDDLHPAANVAKMHSGHPLTDADRAPWLALVRARLDELVDHDQPAVVSCSALRRAYRDVLRRPDVLFVRLHADRQALVERLAQRTGHFMPAALLDSQLAALEPPGPDEHALTLDVTRPTPDLVAAIVAAVHRSPARG